MTTVDNFVSEASGSETSVERLTELARHEDERVTAAVAANGNTPPDVLGELMYLNEDTDRSLAANPHTPFESLEEFGISEDYDWETRELVARNPAATEDLLFRMAEPLYDDDDGKEFDDKRVLVAIAVHPNTSVETLVGLMAQGKKVRKAVASSLNFTDMKSIIRLRNKDFKLCPEQLAFYEFEIARLRELHELGEDFPNSWIEKAYFG